MFALVVGNQMVDATSANEIVSLLRSVLESVHDRSKLYHYKLVGGTKECLSILLGIDELHFECILSICGLWNIESKRYTIKDYRLFDKCQIVFTSMCCKQGDAVLKQKVHFVKEKGERDQGSSVQDI